MERAIKFSYFLSIATVGITLLSGEAQAIQEYELEPEERRTAVIGSYGANVVLRPMTDGVLEPNTALQRISVFEKSDEPCFLATSYRQLRFVEKPGDNTGRVGWKARWEACDPNAGLFSGLGKAGYTESVRDSDRRKFISRVEICTNGRASQRGRLIKGIRITGSFLNRRGYLKPLPIKRLFMRANCSENWADYGEIGCTQEELATGLVLHWQPIGNHPSLTGLQLICQRIKH